MEDMNVTPIFIPDQSATSARTDKVVGFALRDVRSTDGEWSVYLYRDIEDDAGFCIVIGREGDYLTPSETNRVGREHAAIEPADNGSNRVGIIDNSKNGTWIQRGVGNPSLLTKSVFTPLEHGDVIILAKELYITFEYRMGE